MVTQNIGDIEVRLRGDNRQLRQVLDQSQSRVGRFTRSVRNNLGRITVGATAAGAAIGGIAIASVRSFQETDRSLRNLQNQLRRTEAGFGDVAGQLDIVRRISGETGVSVGRLADGFARVDVSGFDTAHIEEFTTHVGRLFQLTQAETSQLGQLISQVDRFNGAARGLTESAAVVSLLSAEQIEDIAEGQTLFRANLAGLSPERTLSIYDALTGAGINQTDAQSLLDNLVEGASGLGLQGTNITIRELAEFTEELGGITEEDLKVFQRLDQEIQSNRAEFENTTQAVVDYQLAYRGLNIEVDKFIQLTRRGQDELGESIVDGSEGFLGRIGRWIAENPLAASIAGGLLGSIPVVGLGTGIAGRIFSNTAQEVTGAGLQRTAAERLAEARRIVGERTGRTPPHGVTTEGGRYTQVTGEVGREYQRLLREERAARGGFISRNAGRLGRFVGRFGYGGGLSSGVPVDLYHQVQVQQEIAQGIRDEDGRPLPQSEHRAPQISDDNVRANRRLGLSYQELSNNIARTEPALDNLRNSFYDNTTTTTRILDEEFEKDKALLDGLSNSVHDTVNIIGIDWERLFPDTPADKLDSAFGSVDSQLRSGGERINKAFDEDIKPEINRISSAWDGLNWRDAWDETDTAVSTAFTSIKTNYDKEIAPIVVTSGLSNLSIEWGDAWTGVKDTASSAWATIKTLYDENISGIFAEDGGFVGGSIWVRDNWGSIWDGVKEKSSSIWGGIKNLYNEHIAPLFDASEDTESPFVGGLRWVNDKWNGIWASVRTRADTAWLGIERAYETHLAPIFDSDRETDSRFVKGVRWVRDQWSGIWAGVQSEADTKWRGISDAYSKWLAPIFRGGSESPPQESDSLFIRGVKWLRDKWNTIWGGITTSASTEWSSIHRHHEQYLDPLFDGAGETPPADTDSPFVRGLKWLRDKWDGIWKDANRSLQAEDGGGGISSLIDTIGQEIQKWRDRLDGAIERAKEFLRLIGVISAEQGNSTIDNKTTRSAPAITIRMENVYGVNDLHEVIVDSIKVAAEQGRLTGVRYG